MVQFIETVRDCDTHHWAAYKANWVQMKTEVTLTLTFSHLHSDMVPEDCDHILSGGTSQVHTDMNTQAGLMKPTELSTNKSKSQFVLKQIILK